MFIVSEAENRVFYVKIVRFSLLLVFFLAKWRSVGLRTPTLDNRFFVVAGTNSMWDNSGRRIIMNPIMDKGGVMEGYNSNESETDQVREHEPSLAELEVYKAVANHYRQDVVQLWTRSNFYLIIHAGLSSIIIATSSKNSFHPVVEIAFEICGLLLAIVWYDVAKSSIEWCKKWRNQLLKVELSVDPLKSYHSVEGKIPNCPMKRPSKYTLWVPVLFGMLWLTLLLVSIIELF
jgi:hypothetical protein